MARAAGVLRAMLPPALSAQEQPGAAGARVRRPGGGRKQPGARAPTGRAAFEALGAPDTRGEPRSPWRWTCNRPRPLAAALHQRGPHGRERMVRTLWHGAGERVPAHTKPRAGRPHPDREAPFGSLHAQRHACLAHGCPVVSVETKPKALVGPCNTGGREWPPPGPPAPGTGHDLPDPAVGHAIPDGLSAVGRTLGGVPVGHEHDPARGAGARWRRWWEGSGRQVAPRADALRVCADSGGSNGYRGRLWQGEWQHGAAATSRQGTVWHVPPGTRTWNKREPRLFSPRSLHGRGRPVGRHAGLVALIGATTTRAGLHVPAARDTGLSPTQMQVSDEALAAVQRTPQTLHGEWHDTMTPTCAQTNL